MRHILVIIMTLLAIANMSTQTEHVRFLDISLDGSIQQFQEELTAKGC